MERTEKKKSGFWRVDCLFDLEREEFLFMLVADFEGWGMGDGWVTFSMRSVPLAGI